MTNECGFLHHKSLVFDFLLCPISPKQIKLDVERCSWAQKKDFRILFMWVISQNQRSSKNIFNFLWLYFETRCDSDWSWLRGHLKCAEVCLIFIVFLHQKLGMFQWVESWCSKRAWISSSWKFIANFIDRYCALILLLLVG